MSRVTGMGPVASSPYPDGAQVKYIVILIGIIGLVTYIFVGGPNAVTGAADTYVDRRQAVWTAIAGLEARRRDMLIRASMQMGSAYSPVSKLSRGGAYAAGYRTGFSQGYFEGSFLAESRRPNPLFFSIPNP
ncbi:conserved hypothetical protein [Solidesulfovibrio fructosivorans JJ]]|uniref:Uncharacterized protein n=1 Tax=Solidesulfovibrio fructosivorans JJ] TaxID=596151 RepID=E1JS70_SOLFR|nr:hypothetical protein [Solidesulfovibrio fructosivorans]EFL52839.1 conserved hypothetical protein [Solidesulfovibrio fructosivorans JJ]]